MSSDSDRNAPERDTALLEVVSICKTFDARNLKLEAQNLVPDIFCRGSKPCPRHPPIKDVGGMLLSGIETSSPTSADGDQTSSPASADGDQTSSPASSPIPDISYRGENVGERHSNLWVLHNVTLSLESRHILCLLGPSGCGKTTLLRIIAGLERPDRGKVLFDGTDMARIPPHRRRFGMMFQEFALFPHKNVFENVAFGLRMQKLPREEISRRTGEMLALVGLDGFGRRGVHTLSGGERQRVALARSLAPSPRLLMLDEPLGSLDRPLRERLLPELRQILKEIGITAIFVTHDHAEAFAMADVIAVFDKGRIEQMDTPENLRKSPANRTVADFLGVRHDVMRET